MESLERLGSGISDDSTSMGVDCLSAHVQGVGYFDHYYPFPQLS
jgi:hypothetical protein